MSNLQASNDSFKYDDLKHAVETIDREIETLEILKNNLDGNLSKALDLLQNTKGRVIVTGMGKSGHIARKMAATFASTGTVSFFVHPAEASHGDLGMISDDDVIIAISYSGESKELSDILIYAKRHNIPLIAITRNPQSALGKIRLWFLNCLTTARPARLGWLLHRRQRQQSCWEMFWPLI